MKKVARAIELRKINPVTKEMTMPVGYIFYGRTLEDYNTEEGDLIDQLIIEELNTLNIKATCVKALEVKRNVDLTPIYNLIPNAAIALIHACIVQEDKERYLKGLPQKGFYDFRIRYNSMWNLFISNEIAGKMLHLNASACKNAVSSLKPF